MAAVNLRIDPDGTVLNLGDRSAGWRFLSLDAPTPDLDSQWASSADTEGARRASTHPLNRTITARIMIEKSSDALLEAEENKLSQKVGKLQREGGELELTVPSGTTMTFTVLEANLQRQWDPASAARHYAFYEVTFVCLPYGLGTEVELGSDTTETTLPYLVKTVTGPAGDVPALGRLLIDNDQAVDQWWLTWGLESRYYSNSANAALFYEAEGRTALGGSATAAGPSGASGGGSNVMRNTSLSTDYLAILSTQATGGGAHLSHIGTFRVYARVQVPTTNAGVVTVALEWAETDFIAYTRSPATTIPAEHEGRWRYVDLDLVTLTQVTAGTQRWEGRIVAKSTVAGDDIDIDYLLLVPVAEGSGIVSGVSRPYTPTAFVGEDRFTSTTAGNALNARVAPTGGSWATSGSATDLVFADAAGSMTSEHITRTATGTRYAVLGTTNYTNVQITGTVLVTGGGDKAGFMARWTDSSNHLHAYAEVDALDATTSINIATVVSGTSTVLATEDIGTQSVPLTLKLAALANGKAMLQAFSSTGTLLATIEASSSVLATGGTLATGEPGIVDVGGSGAARSYDDILVSVPPLDAAVFGSQSIEIRHDRVVREDSGGTLWSRPSSYKGDYLLIPPAGQESRSVRVIVKATRDDPFAEDPAIDDISARLFATPRFLAIPD